VCKFMNQDYRIALHTESERRFSESFTERISVYLENLCSICGSGLSDINIVPLSLYDRIDFRACEFTPDLFCIDFSKYKIM
jgi:hypothetical protein